MIKRSSPTYLIPAVFVTIFAFFPLGALGIKFALEAQKKYKLGDYEGGLSASKKAKKLCFMGTLIAGSIYLSTLAVIGYSSLFSNQIKKTEPTNIDCHVAYRSGTIQQEEKIHLRPTENKNILKMGDLALHTDYLSEQINSQQDSFKIFVTPVDSDKKLATFLYQISSIKEIQKVNNNFPGDRGFTNLNYVYHPQSRAELKYWCTIP